MYELCAKNSSSISLSAGCEMVQWIAHSTRACLGAVPHAVGSNPAVGRKFIKVLSTYNNLNKVNWHAQIVSNYIEIKRIVLVQGAYK